MKKMLLLIASLSLANELSLDDFSQKKYDCYINHISKDYVACNDSVYKNSLVEFKIGNSVIFIDEDNANILAISITDEQKYINIYKDKKLKSKAISNDINKAFLYKDKIILVSLASEIIILDLDFKEIKRIHFSYSSISAASKNDGILALGFESGKIVLLKLSDFTYISKEIHKDNIYNVDYKNHHLISCSTDRKVIISDDKLNTIKTIKANNLVYFCAISNDLDIAYSCDVENNICINDDVLNIGNLYLNSIEFYKNTLQLNAYSNTFYTKEF